MELDKNNTIYVRTVSKLSKNGWQTTIPYEKAMRMVLENAAVIANRTTIYKLFDQKSLRKYVCEIDNYTCVYCGSRG